MHRQNQRMLASLALLSVFFVIALFNSDSAKWKDNLRRRLETISTEITVAQEQSNLESTPAALQERQDSTTEQSIREENTSQATQEVTAPQESTVQQPNLESTTAALQERQDSTTEQTIQKENTSQAAQEVTAPQESTQESTVQQPNLESTTAALQERQDSTTEQTIQQENTSQAAQEVTAPQESTAEQPNLESTTEALQERQDSTTEQHIREENSSQSEQEETAPHGTTTQQPNPESTSVILEEQHETTAQQPNQADATFQTAQEETTPKESTAEQTNLESTPVVLEERHETNVDQADATSQAEQEEAAPPESTAVQSNPESTSVVVEERHELIEPNQQENTSQTSPEDPIPPQTTPTTPQSQTLSSTMQESEAEIEVVGNLARLHDDMCSDDWANAPPLPYDRCDANGIVNGIPLFGGLTNALKLILLGAIGSFEENRCFFVDESNSKLNPPDEQGVKHGFLHKYMEPIGLPLDHPIVVTAQKEYRTKTLVWMDSWREMSARRAYGQYSNLPNLGMNEVEGHNLKRNLIRRMWRPLPKYRKSSCSGMENTHGLKAGDYMAFSVRRGDKTEEDYSFTDLDLYITEAEKHLHRFASFTQNHEVPKIFVATDDCSVMSEFRRMRPDWRFTSECDIEHNSEAAAKDGFALSDFKDWGVAAEEAHFTKFFTEIYAMTMSRVFIGVSYTNVSWWVYFLRSFRHSFILLDKPEGEPDSYILDNW